MSSARPWPLPSQVWTVKPKAAYDKLRNSGDKETCRDVLHINELQYNDLAIWVQEWMANKDLTHFSSRRDETLLNDALQALKNDPVRGRLLRWPESQGESTENVDRALKFIFKSEKHNATRAGSRRNKVLKDRRDEPSSTSQQAAPSPLERKTSLPAIDHKPTLTPSKDYANSIMFVRFCDQQYNRLVKIDQFTTLYHIRKRALETWHSWTDNRDITTLQLEFRYYDQGEPYYSILQDERDWQVALQNAEQTQERLRVLLSIPWSRPTDSIPHSESA